MTRALRDPSRLVFLDGLTQLYNWWFMAQYLRDRVPWLSSEKVPLGVILVDLDDFRKVNEAHGRLAGDVVLRQVALLLHEGRQRGGYAVRYAGDEFFVFLEGADGERARGVAEEIRRRVAQELIAIPHAGDGVSLTASLGVAALPEDAETASRLIERVRRAAAHAKRLGKNRVSRDVGERLPTEQEALRQLHRPRLFGREQELAFCRGLLERAGEPGNRLVLVEGPHGVGKSRLLAELPALARAAGLPFLQGGCLAENRSVPYSAVTPWIQEYFDRAPERVAPVAARLAGPRLAALGTILPLLEGRKGRAETMPPPERRRELFHGLLDLLGLMSEGGPLVVFLEGLHWADEASLEALLHLLSREDGRLLVFATAAPEPLEETPWSPRQRSLAAFLPYLTSSPRFHRLTLAPLTLGQVGDLAADLLRYPAIPLRFQQQLFEVSGGVPLLVEETLTGLITRGALRREEEAWNFDQVMPEDFPASADEAIARRLESLDADTLEVVTEASIIGQDVDLPVLAEVLGKDAGETLHFVEQGRQSGVFETGDPLADPGEIRFSNRRLREIVYDSVDPGHKRQTHRKVAEAYERLGGEERERLGAVSYHYERSDDAGKAGFYREKLRALWEWIFSPTDVGTAGGGAGVGTGAGAGTGAGTGTGTGAGAGAVGVGGGGETGTVKVRIPEATEPLPDKARPLAVQFTKTLTLAAKNMRVFPEGSELVRQEVEAAAAAVVALLGELPAVTLGERRGSLVVNGEPVEGKALGALSQDLLRVFREHGIRSVTFVRDVIEVEIAELLRLLSAPPLRLPPEVGRWEEELTARGILHIGIFPAIYLATALAPSEGTEEERLLDDEAMRIAAETFRSLAGAVDNLRLYPPENELNVAIQERLAAQVDALLERAPAVTLALADDALVINGAPPNPKWFGIVIPMLHKLMQEQGLTSITLRRGVAGDDLRLFLGRLAQPGSDDPMSPAALGRVLEEQGVRTIQVGSRYYQAARASLTGGGRAGGGAGGATGEGTGAAASDRSEEERLLEQVVRWLDTPTPTTRPEEDLSAVMASWLESDRTDLARRLLERIVQSLSSPVEGIRQRAASGLQVLLTGSKGRAVGWAADIAREPLAAALRQEAGFHAFQWEMRAAVAVLRILLARQELDAAAALADALGRAQAKKPEAKKFLPVAGRAVDALTSVGALAPVREALRDPSRREAARRFLGALGEAGGPFLAKVVAEEEDDDARAAAAALLHELPGAGLPILVPQLHPPAAAEVSRRIASVLDILAPQLGADFIPLLAHPDVLVRAEFAGVMGRVPRARALKFLERALEERQAAILTGVVECVRGLRATELLEALVDLVRRSDSPETLKAVCLCLGHLRDPRAAAPLMAVLERRPRLLGIVKGLPDTVRAAAARALGDLGAPEARPALRAALKDPSLSVRSVARVALARLGGGRGEP
jgi:diguanylate cyclase (GGDEF)-like protein